MDIYVQYFAMNLENVLEEIMYLKKVVAKNVQKRSHIVFIIVKSFAIPRSHVLAELVQE